MSQCHSICNLHNLQAVTLPQRFLDSLAACSQYTSVPAVVFVSIMHGDYSSLTTHEACSTSGSLGKSRFDDPVTFQGHTDTVPDPRVKTFINHGSPRQSFPSSSQYMREPTSFLALDEDSAMRRVAILRSGNHCLGRA